MQFCDNLEVVRAIQHLTPKSAKPCFIIVPGAFQSSLFAAAFCGRSTLCPSLMEEDYFPSDSQQNHSRITAESLAEYISNVFVFRNCIPTPHSTRHSCMHSFALSIILSSTSSPIYPIPFIHAFIHSLMHSCIQAYRRPIFCRVIKS